MSTSGTGSVIQTWVLPERVTVKRSRLFLLGDGDPLATVRMDISRAALDASAHGRLGEFRHAYRLAQKRAERRFTDRVLRVLGCAIYPYLGRSDIYVIDVLFAAPFVLTDESTED